MPTDPVELFLARWHDTERAERANKDLFLTELCDLLGVPRPAPAGPGTADNAATFSRGQKEPVAEILAALVVVSRAHKGEKRGTFTS